MYTIGDGLKDGSWETYLLLQNGEKIYPHNPVYDDLLILIEKAKPKDYAFNIKIVYAKKGIK